jgi:peroxiredoxin
MSLNRLLAGLLLLTLATRALPAPEGAADDANPAPGPLPGHSYHGEAFDEGPRRAAYLMGNTGKVRFPITSKAPQAQAFFEQGVGQLHGFWYLEAERSFRQVAALDRDCAMAYWGMAMANVNNDKRARSFLAEAVKRNKGLTKYESMWIDALSAQYDEKKEENARRREHVRKLEAIVQAFPAEAEPKAFLALTIWNNDSRLPITSHQAVDALLDQVFAIEPMHPAHHYRIHLWDGEKPERALSAAARCGQSSPAIAHMWHMPGHTYSKLYRYEDAAWQQEAASRVDHADMVRDGVMPYQIHNYFHNQEWLVRDLSYLGRVRDGINLSKNLIELPRHPKYNLSANRSSGADFGRMRLMDLLAQWDLWDEYLKLADTVYLDEDGTPESQLRRTRYLGVACAATGNNEAADAQVKKLEAMAAKLKAEQEEAADKAEDEAKAKNEPEEKQAAAAGRARRDARNRRRDIERAVAHVRGQQALVAKDYDKALELLTKADLRKDKLALVNLAAGKKDRAENLARQAAEADKSQVYPLAAYTQVLYANGKKDEAKATFEKLRAASSRPDLDVPALVALEPIAKDFGFGDDWRLPYKDPGDVGTRPSLDSLGPFRWHPSPAADWQLPTADGGTVALKDFRGKPVVILFYLGHGCVHCTEQLSRFAPKVKDFEKAGISVVAISTDRLEDLSKSVNAVKAEGNGPFPIRLMSDAKLDVFKRYAAYDDFEKLPLHGTFLVDGRGLIRWQDVAAEPFNDPAFLLAEAKRLLAQGEGERAEAR